MVFTDNRQQREQDKFLNTGDEPAVRTTSVDSDGNAYSDTNRLPVDAQLEVSEVNIGAVEIKDGDTEDRMSVNSDGSINVQGIVATTSSSDLQYSQVTAPNGGVETTILTYSPTVDVYLKQIVGGGDNDGTFQIKIDGVTKLITRNTASVPQISIPFEDFEVLSTQTVTVTVLNDTTETNDYEVSLFFR